MRSEPRSGCPINAAVEALGDPWSLIVLRDVMFGDRRYFRELLAGSEEGIASNVLSSRLKSLVAAGLLGTAGCKGYGVVASEGTVVTSAGTVAVQCIDRTKVRISGASPAAGYSVTIVVEGPAGQASLVFENPNANDFRVAVHCDGGVPGYQEFEIEDTTLTD